MFFIGLAALALPIIAHLISRKSGVKLSFPAVSFLVSSQGDLSSRSRIKDIIFLILRALILVFIVLIFAKPAVFSFSEKVDNTPKSIAIVIDNSFSMGYENNFGKAKKKAHDIIDAIADGSFSFVAPLVKTNEKQLDVIQDKSRLRGALQNIKLSNGFSDNERRLQDIYSKLLKTPNQIKRVVFITDLQKNGWKDEKFDPPWLDVIDISQTSETANHAVADVDLRYEENSTTIKAQVSNYSSDSLSGLITTFSFDEKEIREGIDVEPHGSSSLGVSFESGDLVVSHGTVSTTHDKLKIDDIRYFISDGPDSNSKILIVDGDPREDSRLSESYYLAQALETISEISGTQVTILDNDAFLREDLSNFEVIYLANVGELTPRITKQLEVFIEKGGSAVIFLGNSTRASSYNVLLKNILPGEIIGIAEGSTSITAVDNSGWFSKEIADKMAQVKIEKRYNIRPHPGSEAIINTSGDSPLLIGKQKGNGNVYLFTSTADNSWNNFSITPVFLPIIKRINDSPISGRNKSRQYLVNQSVEIETAEDAKSIVVVDPQGEKYEIDRGNNEFRQTRVPGIYTVESDGEYSYIFAVNIDSSESNLEKLPDSSFGKQPDQKTSLVKVFKEVWSYFLWGVIALFVSESVFRAIFS